MRECAYLHKNIPRKKNCNTERVRVMEMIEGVGLGSHEIIEAQAHVWKHVFNFISSMSLKCALHLGIPDTINNHGRPMSLSDLVDALPVSPTKAACLHRLMRLNVHLGFFAIQKKGDEDQEGYVLTPSSKLLLKESSTSLAPFALMMLDPVLVNPWQWLSQWFQGKGGTPFEAAHGSGLWECAAQSPKINGFFNESMASDSRLIMGVVVKEFGHVFQGLESLVDMGGGTGTAARAIAEAFPHLKCTLFDLPHVVATLPESSELEYVGGDMFESIPPADAIFLKWILHNWSDEDCVRILKLCKEAIPSKEEGGKVIILEMVIDAEKGDHQSVETRLFFDMSMMVDTYGRERTQDDWSKIFKDAGFSNYKFTPIFGMRSLIEAYP